MTGRDIPGLDSTLYAQAENLVPNLTACDVFESGQIVGYALGTSDMLIGGFCLFFAVMFARLLGDILADFAIGVRARWWLRRKAREARRVRPIEGS